MTGVAAVALSIPEYPAKTSGERSIRMRNVATSQRSFYLHTGTPPGVPPQGVPNHLQAHATPGVCSEKPAVHGQRQAIGGVGKEWGNEDIHSIVYVLYQNTACYSRSTEKKERPPPTRLHC